ncbi:MAG: hypothetical protein DI623_06750 [Sphingomonas sanxanigenens]|jgi:hypothetical protein|uniref:Uncharacterized protein n=1 Tax=Sphingomonas sanxanigenens TaxID=397260 RepID=A0A2W5AB82_9SPHN|nr:MAG: hypothetical protein DI623_06750 [Sphingomonas sanxanigenens]
MQKHHHILPAASNLLGIALLIIAGLNLTKVARTSLADEVAWAAAVCLSLSCLFSYLAIRAEPQSSAFEPWADRIFFAGLILLCGSVLVLAF